MKEFAGCCIMTEQEFGFAFPPETREFRALVEKFHAVVHEDLDAWKLARHTLIDDCFEKQIATAPMANTIESAGQAGHPSVLLI